MVHLRFRCKRKRAPAFYDERPSGCLDACISQCWPTILGVSEPDSTTIQSGTDSRGPSPELCLEGFNISFTSFEYLLPSLKMVLKTTLIEVIVLVSESGRCDRKKYHDDGLGEMHIDEALYDRLEIIWLVNYWFP